ncbi:MAG: hypothetical protein KBT20_10225, partial [Bacteroidales bacterium]|nr:hypothetical protein [Candidatus Liminaster caballi]
GRHGDIAEWLREMDEAELASKVESISSDLSDSAFFAHLKAVITGTEVKDIESLKPEFDKCFTFEGMKCDVKDNEAKVTVTLKVLMSVNEKYELCVSSNWGTRALMVNPYDCPEGKTVTFDFTLRKRPGKEIGKLSFLVDGTVLTNQLKEARKSIQKANHVMLSTLQNKVDSIKENKDNNEIKSTSDDERYRLAKQKLDAIQKNIKEHPFHVYDAYDGVGSSDREKEEDIINKEIRPLAERGHKLASIDYYWYLFVRRYEVAEIFAKSYEANHQGEKLIEPPLTDDQLYEKVQEMFCIISDMRSRSLSRTAWTGGHSTDINACYDIEEENVYNKFIIPLIKKGHRKSCLDYYKKLLSKDREKAKLFLYRYRSEHPGDKLVEYDSADQVFGFQTDGIVKGLRENIRKKFLK